MIDNFAGKTAVLTGAGSGFGLECARIGARLGMNLVLVDVQQDALERAAVDYFQNLLAYAGGDMAKAQQLSGLSRAQFYRLLRKLR